MIMAGGSGTRLWPVSRKDRPKQLAPIINGRSLLDIAIERARAVAPPEHISVCASANYLDAIKAAAPDLPNDLLLGEPVGRDTVNAIGFAAAILAKRDPDAAFCVLTADHLIEPLDAFVTCIHTGFELVESDPDRLVTFAITPTYAATGFGYVQKGEAIKHSGGAPAFEVERFVEKPNAEKAREYVDSGAFGWNSGMFVWKAATFLRAVEKFQSEAHAGLMKIADDWGGAQQDATLARVYPTLPKISVDFAIMEPAGDSSSGFKVCAVEMDLSWRDVGSWPSYAETLDADDHGVRSNDSGAAHTVLDCANTLIVSDDPDHHIAALGMRDVVIVHTPTATLVMPASEAQRLKDLHALLPERLK